MAARAFAVAVIVLVLGLAGLELRVLWPLVGASIDEFELQQLGEVDLTVQGKEVRLHGLAATPSGVLWVADIGGPQFRLLALDSDGQLIEQFPGTQAPGISADGEAVLTVDPTTSRLLRIERGSGVTGTWDMHDFGLYVPTGAVRLREDAFAVAATGSGLVALFQDNLHDLGVLGVSQQGRPQLLEPQYPLVDSQGRLYVSDRLGRVIRWNERRNDVTFETRGREPAVLSDPRQFAIDAQGRLWVADERAGRVWVFDTESGDLIGDWRPDVTPNPVALTISGDRIYITDFGGTFIYWFQLPP